MDTMTGSVSGTVRTTSGGESVSETVVNAVADAKGVDPLDLDPLYDAIDPDALDSIFQHSSGTASAEISFEMAGCEVLVRDAGEVVVAPMPGADEATGRVHSCE